LNTILLTNIYNATKPKSHATYDLSVQSWRKWAERNNAEVLVLDEPITDMNEMSPIYFRHYWPEMVELSDDDQICLVDADTIVHPDCPNFFNLTQGQFSAVHNDGDYDWVIRSIENYEYEFEGVIKVTPDDVWSYFNTGFMVTNKKYRWLHDKFLEFYWINQKNIIFLQQKYGVGTDQPLLNYFVRHNDVKVKILPYFLNMQDLARKNVLDERMLFTRMSGIYHFNATPGGPNQVNYWMEKTFKYLYE
jgi:hypothetical protein